MPLDGHYIAKLERGAVRRTGKLYREALRAVLGVATDRELGMGHSDRPQLANRVRLATGAYSKCAVFRLPWAIEDWITGSGFMSSVGS